MNYLRRLQIERPWLFLVAIGLCIWLGFQIVLWVAAAILGPFGLPYWAPMVLVLGVLVLIARRQQRTR